MADNILKRWTSKWVQAVAGSGAHLSEIVGMLAQTEAAHADRTELALQLSFCFEVSPLRGGLVCSAPD